MGQSVNKVKNQLLKAVKIALCGGGGDNYWLRRTKLKISGISELMQYAELFLKHNIGNHSESVQPTAILTSCSA
jgi:hypothetical protein